MDDPVLSDARVRESLERVKKDFLSAAWAIKGEETATIEIFVLIEKWTSGVCILCKQI